VVRRWLVLCFAAVLAAPAAAQPAAPPGAVRGLPVAAQPGAGVSLPTDGLMSPVPVVPPRTAYQLPPAVTPPPPGAPPRTRVPDLNLPENATIPLPGAPGRSFQFGRRYGRLFNFNSEQLDPNTQRIVITGGVIVSVSPGPGQPAMEFATDSAVVWVTGAKVANVAEGFDAGPETKREVELYLTGNVVIRTVSYSPNGDSVGQTLRAEEIYYDVPRHRAVAVNADLELSAKQLPDAVHLTGKEIRRLDRENWEILDGSTFSSKLPSDPGLQLTSPRTTMRDRVVQQTNIFGIPYRDFAGNPVEEPERILTVRNAVTRLADIPVFYLPYLRVDANDPLGPLTAIGLGQDRIFGTQVYTTWDMYKLIALRPPEGHKWRLDLDYLSDRGPAVGTNYDYTLAPSERGYSPGSGFVRLYGLSDEGVDVIGGGRGVEPTHPDFRGRAQWRHVQELFSADTYFQGQVSYLSDQNFLEQFYKAEFDVGPNQETFAYLTHRYRNMWAAGLVQPKLDRNWQTQTQWLPRVDGAITGESFWDLLNYNARANAGYAMLRPSQQNPFAVLPTDRAAVDTGRFNLNQEVSVPFDLGPVRLAPYGTLDLAYYTQDLTGEDRGRVYGGGGLRANLPFSRLYEGASSELLNVRGLFHKASVGFDYYYARSSTPYTNLPQLDRLNDDVTDYTYNYARTYVPQFLPGDAGQALAFSPQFDAQRYAIRRVVDNRTDTLDDIHVVRLENRNRLQTKRGYPGLEHTVDVFSLNLGASFFPNPARDNFENPWAFLEYDSQWNIGDRLSVMSAGWVDPFDLGARYWNVGASLDRPDRTSFYFGYRQTDPVNSKTVTGSVAYQLSRRYYTGVSVSYDFGMQQALTNSFSITRTGADMTFTFGVTYNALVNNFGVQFLLVPNLVAYSAQNRLGGGIGGFSQR